MTPREPPFWAAVLGWLFVAYGWVLAIDWMVRKLGWHLEPEVPAEPVHDAEPERRIGLRKAICEACGDSILVHVDAAHAMCAPCIRTMIGPRVN